MKIKKASAHFEPIAISAVYNHKIEGLTAADCSNRVLREREHLLTGEQILWGMPFQLGNSGSETENILLLKNEAVTINFDKSVNFNYLMVLHSVDFKETKLNQNGIYSPMKGNPRLGEVVAEYQMQYRDGSQAAVPIKRRFNINEFQINWGENSFECVPHTKPESFRTNSEEINRGNRPERNWGQSQTRAAAPGDGILMNHWLYALTNPHPERELTGIKLIPRAGTDFFFGITGTNLSQNPLCWEKRKKMKISLPAGESLNDDGDYRAIDLDLGQIISVSPCLNYNHQNWEKTYQNQEPGVARDEIIVEYTAHPEACIYLGENTETIIPLTEVTQKRNNRSHGFQACQVSVPEIPVTFKILDKENGKPVAAKIHIHGEVGEYLAPVNRHRLPNPCWFEDYSTDFVHGHHCCTYIDGTAEYKLPQGSVFVEVTRGFEITPIRRVYQIDRYVQEITIELEHVLPWRQKGWVTADTHVHFLSPQTARLEGEAEGVNVVNLLSSQWGELFTNIGDFDGETTIGSRENGGNGEYLVRVGTENRQHILGHISLLGYEGQMILPLTTGGPDESALGDPVAATLSDWAKQCREANGINILPHFPNPRTEGAAALVLELIDGVEMTSWGDFYGGLSPYSLSDWYRYLNCGYQVPAVGGTDKMSATTAVGTVRTYALIEEQPFTYENWKQAIREGLTFVTYGPLVDFQVNGQTAGSQINLPTAGGTLDIEWQVASVTIPVTRIELIVNGEIKEIEEVEQSGTTFSGSWSLKLNQSGWIALRVRGKYPDKKEMIAAHSSTVMVNVARERCFDSQDAMTILEQIEGATAYVKTLGTRAEEKTYKQLLMTLTAAHRNLHNRMHQQGIYHDHSAVDDHHQQE